MGKTRMHEEAEEARVSARGGGIEQRAGDAAQQHAEPSRRPSPVEYRPWRGDGIVGDRHTD